MKLRPNVFLCRMLIFLILMFYTFLFSITLTGFEEEIELWQSHNIILKVTLCIFGVIETVSIFLLWGLMFYHWGTHRFSNKNYKIMWFLLMSIGMFVGSWIYYLVVYELKKTINQEIINDKNN